MLRKIGDVLFIAKMAWELYCLFREERERRRDRPVVRCVFCGGEVPAGCTCAEDASRV